MIVEGKDLTSIKKRGTIGLNGHLSTIAPYTNLSKSLMYVFIVSF